MSTITTNYSLIKPDPSEASGPEEMAENMILTERALINLEVGSSTGRQNINRLGSRRNASGSAQAINTEGAWDDLTWTNMTSSGLWTPIYDVDGNWGPPSLGLIWDYTSGAVEFNHPGFYKVIWNLRLQASNTTSSEGFVRATLFGGDGVNSYSVANGVQGSSIVIPINTMTTLTDIGAEMLIKVTQPERTSEVGNYLTTGKNQQEYFENTGFYRFFNIGFAHNNTGSATMTPLLDETYIHVEFIRSL